SFFQLPDLIVEVGECLSGIVKALIEISARVGKDSGLILKTIGELFDNRFKTRSYLLPEAIQLLL
ncbi:MAG: hypothetical protein Q7S98_00545, partial [Deltaproteobacteria bacterium]|nr:hypothetical protein [Deltaproteobacteria bacterium]